MICRKICRLNNRYFNQNWPKVEDVVGTTTMTALNCTLFVSVNTTGEDLNVKLTSEGMKYYKVFDRAFFS